MSFIIIMYKVHFSVLTEQDEDKQHAGKAGNEVEHKAEVSGYLLDGTRSPHQDRREHKAHGHAQLWNNRFP